MEDDEKTPACPVPVLSLNLLQVGIQLTLVPAQMALLGHATPQSTLWYGTDDLASPEAKFVRDMFTMDPYEMVDKWYGGRIVAARLGVEMAARALESEPSTA